jgi:general stress protein CsbA
MPEGMNIRQFFVGLNILILGVLYYFFFRTAEHTYFLKFFENTPQLKHLLPPLLVALGNSLPTFIHVFAFTLMTAGLFASKEKGYAIVCFFWFTIDTLFELGQGFNNMLNQVIPAWFSDFFLLEKIKNYFLHGRFDYLDLFSIAVGSVLAYMLLIKTKITRSEAI